MAHTDVGTPACLVGDVIDSGELDSNLSGNTGRREKLLCCENFPRDNPPLSIAVVVSVRPWPAT